jgi:D-lactate dehydrogenase
MRLAVFSAKPYDRSHFDLAAAGGRHRIDYQEARLEPAPLPLAAGYDAGCAVVNDLLDAPVLEGLARLGVKGVVLRCAGFNNVDLPAAHRLGLPILRVPAYSPHAVSEHTVALVLALDRHLHRAYNRVRDGNFSLVGLLGRGLHGRTVGVIGTGAIGELVVRLFHAFGCPVLVHDPVANPSLAAISRSVPLEELLRDSDVVSLHCPLTEATRHLIDAEAIASMREGVVIVNTGRGGLIDTAAVIEGLKTGHIGGLAIDVYEEEAGLFFEDKSAEVLTDDVFARLLTFPNVLVTGHQGFFTEPALTAIAETTMANLDALAAGGPYPNAVG